MLKTLRNAWAIPELRKRLIFTFLMVALYRMGNFIPVPGVNTSNMTNLTSSGSLFAFYDMISGGAFSKFSIFAMGVTPYINASIIMQLLVIAIPYLESLSKEGEDGRKKIANYTRYSTIVFALLQSFGTYALITQQQGVTIDQSRFNVFLVMLTLTTSAVFVMWLGEQITDKGFGNGISLLIFINIISRVPSTVYQIAGLQSAQTVNFVEVILFVIVVAGLFLAVIMMSLAERRIPVQYAGRAAANGKTFKGQSTHIPINAMNSAVIAIIFAMSVMQFPQIIGQFWPKSTYYQFITASKWSLFVYDSWQYAFLYFVLIIFFTWFYTQITFKPDEMAENMHKSSGFIPGIRPGEATAKYIEKVLGKVAIIGGIFAALIAVFPIILETYTSFKGIYFGGTALLIEVGVALETMRQLEAQLVMRHYHGFLKQ